jgi:hypothetical protein
MRSDEEVRVLARVAEAKQRLRDQSKPTPYTPPQTVVDEETMAAGVKRQRVLTLLDKLYKDGAGGLTYERYAAGRQLAQQFEAELPKSQGLSSYGANVHATEPSGKADRVGRRLTGYRIEPDGTIRYAGGKRSMQNMRRLEDALFAAVGCHDEDGRRVINIQHAELLLRIVTWTERLPNLTQIAKELSDFYHGQKQLPPFAMGWLYTVLGRLAQHYGMMK